MCGGGSAFGACSLCVGNQVHSQQLTHHPRSCHPTLSPHHIYYPALPAHVEISEALPLRIGEQAAHLAVVAHNGLRRRVSCKVLDGLRTHVHTHRKNDGLTNVQSRTNIEEAVIVSGTVSTCADPPPSGEMTPGARTQGELLWLPPEKLIAEQRYCRANLKGAVQTFLTTSACVQLV